MKSDSVYFGPALLIKYESRLNISPQPRHDAQTIRTNKEIQSL